MKNETHFGEKNGIERIFQFRIQSFLKAPNWKFQKEKKKEVEKLFCTETKYGPLRNGLFFFFFVCKMRRTFNETFVSKAAFGLCRICSLMSRELSRRFIPTNILFNYSIKFRRTVFKVVIRPKYSKNYKDISERGKVELFVSK